jgi:hypothetical protein
VFAADIGFDSASGVLSVNGSAGIDFAEVRQQDMNFVVSDVAATENTVLAGTVLADVAVGDFVVDEVPPSLTNPVNPGCTIFRPVLYVYNETPADGSYGGVASALIEISSVVYGESDELVAGSVWEDCLTGSQYLLPAEMTLVSERDLTGLLQYCGISEYRAEDQGRWVIPVSPDEGIGFLGRALSLTFYYGYLAGETPTEVFSSSDFSVEVVLAAADPATGRDMKLVLPDTQIGIYYETVTIGSDGNDQPLVEEGNHVVDGDADADGSDAVEVSQQDKNLVVSLISASGQLSPTMPSATWSQIAFSATVGDDTFTNLTVMPVRRRR